MCTSIWLYECGYDCTCVGEHVCDMSIHRTAWVWVCMCVNVHMAAYMWVWLYQCMSICVYCIYSYGCMFVNVGACMRLLYMFIWLIHVGHTCVLGLLYVHMASYVCVCVCGCVCAVLYGCIYTVAYWTRASQCQASVMYQAPLPSAGITSPPLGLARNPKTRILLTRPSPQPLVLKITHPSISRAQYCEGRVGGTRGWGQRADSMLGKTLTRSSWAQHSLSLLL